MSVGHCSGIRCRETEGAADHYLPGQAVSLLPDDAADVRQEVRTVRRYQCRWDEREVKLSRATFVSRPISDDIELFHRSSTVHHRSASSYVQLNPACSDG